MLLAAYDLGSSTIINSKDMVTYSATTKKETGY